MTLLVTFFCLRGAGRRRAARPGLWATCRTPRLSGGGLAPPPPAAAGRELRAQLVLHGPQAEAPSVRPGLVPSGALCRRLPKLCESE